MADSTLTCAVLRVSSPESQSKVALDGAGPWRIGRGPANDIELIDSKASRVHAMLQHTEGDQFMFLDLGSRNGSYVNRRRVTVPAYLSDGDRISIGDHEILFDHPNSSPNVKVQDRVAKDLDATTYQFAVQSIGVLVVDIREFTKLSQSVNESVLARTIGTWVGECGTVLDEHGSWSQKYIGDAVMSIWLMEGPREKRRRGIADLFRALAKIVEVTSTLHEKFDLPGPVSIGAGINNGLASLGNVRSDSSADYTAVGDSVNLAFRLESATRPIGVDVLVGPGTIQELGEEVGLERLLNKHSVKLKGYANPVTAYSTNFESLTTLVDALVKAGDGDKM